MTDEFTQDRQRQVEEYLGRKLEPHELITVSSLDKLTPGQSDIVRMLAVKHRLVCMIYLCGVVEGLLIRDAFALIDAIRFPNI